MCKGRSPQSAVSRDKMRSSLKSLEIYKDAVVIGEVVWDHVAGWNHLAQDTIGKQMIHSADSIAVSLAEGYGTITKERILNSATTAAARWLRHRLGSK